MKLMLLEMVSTIYHTVGHRQKKAPELYIVQARRETLSKNKYNITYSKGEQILFFPNG